METPNPKRKSDRLFAAIQAQDREQTLHYLTQLLSDCGYYGGRAFIEQIQDHLSLQAGYAWLKEEGLFEQAFRGRQAPQKPDVQSTLGFKPS